MTGHAHHSSTCTRSGTTAFIHSLDKGAGRCSRRRAALPARSIPWVRPPVACRAWTGFRLPVRGRFSGAAQAGDAQACRPRSASERKPCRARPTRRRDARQEGQRGPQGHRRRARGGRGAAAEGRRRHMQRGAAAGGARGRRALQRPVQQGVQGPPGQPQLPVQHDSGARLVPPQGPLAEGPVGAADAGRRGPGRPGAPGTRGRSVPQRRGARPGHVHAAPTAAV
jgi:hypothetical protein